MIVWGADIGMRRISLAAVALDDDGQATFHVLSGKVPGPDKVGHAETFVLLGAKTERLATELVAEMGGKPDRCKVEKPAAHPDRGVSQEMSWSYAINMAALHPFGPTDGIMPQSWKSRSLGKGFGRADKNTILAWARRFGYGGSSHDEADAIGIAVAGLQMLRAEVESAHEQMTLG